MGSEKMMVALGAIATALAIILLALTAVSLYILAQLPGYVLPSAILLTLGGIASATYHKVKQ